MNTLISVLIADGDYTSNDDFYSLIDATGVITSPAVTGCVITLTDDRYSEAITGLATGASAYLDWVFYDDAAPTVAIPLAAAGSISEGADGVYTINEAAILTTGHTYQLENTSDKYDVPQMEVVCP